MNGQNEIFRLLTKPELWGILVASDRH
jgi:hypothetical protein